MFRLLQGNISIIIWAQGWWWNCQFLNDCNFGKKFTTAAQCFRKVPKSPVFVFEYSTHMFISELHHCLERHATIWKQSRTHLLWCQNDMVHHLSQPFFGCNKQVRMVYKSLLRDVSTTTEEKKSFGAVSTNLMQRYIDENKGDELCYETGA